MVDFLIVFFFMMFIYIIYYNVMSKFFERRRTFLAIPIYMVFGVFCSFFDTRVTDLLRAILILITFLISSSILFRGEVKRMLVISLFYIIVMIGVEICSESIIGIMDMKRVIWGDMSMVQKILFVSVEPIIIFAISRLIVVFGNYRYSSDKKILNVCMLLIPASTLFVYDVLLNLLAVNFSNKEFSKVIFFSCILLLVSNILFYVIFDRFMLIDEKNRIISMQELKNSLDTKYSEMNLERDLKKKSYIHDIKRHMRIIGLLSDEGRCDEIKNIVSSLIDRLDEIDHVEYTSSAVLNSIIAEKVAESKKLGIENFEIDIDRSTDFSFIDEVDQIIIFSNALDNAIEAAVNARNPEISVYVQNYFPMNATIIRIRNSFDGNIRIENNRYVSTKGNDGTRGIGLKNIEDAVEKYNGLCTVNIDGDYFVLNITICCECACF